MSPCQPFWQDTVPQEKQHWLVNELVTLRHKYAIQKGLLIKSFIWALNDSNRQNRNSKKKKKPTSIPKDVICSMLCCPNQIEIAEEGKCCIGAFFLPFLKFLHAAAGKIDLMTYTAKL